MRTVVQRVTCAAVAVGGRTVGSIGPGLMVLVGFRKGDDEAGLAWMATKLLGLRIFEDAAQRMNLDLSEVGGELLLVPQFTLYGDCRKGRRPGFDEALEPVTAAALFDRFCALCTAQGASPQRGVFGAHMQVTLTNDGPVTIIIDSP